MEVNGIAHIFICAGDFPAARAFYSQLLPFLGMTCVADNPGIYYCVGGRTGFGIEAATPEHLGKRFEQGTVGLHHVCFRARSREDVEEAHAFLVKIGAKMIHGPQEDRYAPGSTRSCSRIPTAPGSRSTTSPAPACSRAPECKSAKPSAPTPSTLPRRVSGAFQLDRQGRQVRQGGSAPRSLAFLGGLGALGGRTGPRCFAARQGLNPERHRSP